MKGLINFCSRGRANQYSKSLPVVSKEWWWQYWWIGFFIKKRWIWQLTGSKMLCGKNSGIFRNLKILKWFSVNFSLIANFYCTFLRLNVFFLYHPHCLVVVNKYWGTTFVLVLFLVWFCVSWVSTQIPHDW